MGWHEACGFWPRTGTTRHGAKHARAGLKHALCRAWAWQGAHRTGTTRPV
jgi:hypothetical protein